MRLLNTKTLVLRKFETDTIPAYAILSHTWEDDEVTLQNFHIPAARQTRSFRKISDFCREAAARGIEWGWVDTCCIDKTNHVELSLAINSMFTWYRMSAICLTYLSDFHYWQRGDRWNHGDLRRCRWFTRGWTLQELIAPPFLVFYDAAWRRFGTKDNLADLVSNITGVSSSLLRDERTLQDFSIAQKMSWAADRKTTRVEDRTYSLFGLFNIYISPMYGEGWRAFGRLQEKILNVSTDQSIFAWRQNGTLTPLEKGDEHRTEDMGLRHRCSILAPTPDCFYDSWSVIVPTDLDPDRAHPRLAQHLSGFDGKELYKLNMPIALSSTGLHISLLVKSISKLGSRHLVEAMLNCCDEDDPTSAITIFLVANMHGRVKDGKHAIVPAWRVEPYYLGTAASMEEGSLVATFDLYPIHPVWTAVPDDLRSAEATQEEHAWQRREARKRIERAKRHRIKNDDKATSATISFMAISGMVMLWSVERASKKHDRQQDSKESDDFRHARKHKPLLDRDASYQQLKLLLK